MPYRINYRLPPRYTRPKRFIDEELPTLTVHFLTSPARPYTRRTSCVNRFETPNKSESPALANPTGLSLSKIRLLARCEKCVKNGKSRHKLVPAFSPAPRLRARFDRNVSRDVRLTARAHQQEHRLIIRRSRYAAELAHAIHRLVIHFLNHVARL